MPPSLPAPSTASFLPESLLVMMQTLLRTQGKRSTSVCQAIWIECVRDDYGNPQARCGFGHAGGGGRCLYPFVENSLPEREQEVQACRKCGDEERCSAHGRRHGAACGHLAAAAPRTIPYAGLSNALWKRECAQGMEHVSETAGARVRGGSSGCARALCVG